MDFYHQTKIYKLKVNEDLLKEMFKAVLMIFISLVFSWHKVSIHLNQNILSMLVPQYNKSKLVCEDHLV